MLQLRVRVYDSFNPNQWAEVLVIIEVRRNVNSPQFSQRTYEARVAENYPIGQKVTTVSATDRDGDEVRYRLLGPADALGFFYINPLSGDLSVTRPLTESTEREYSVCYIYTYSISLYKL